MRRAAKSCRTAAGDRGSSAQSVVTYRPRTGPTVVIHVTYRPQHLGLLVRIATLVALGDWVTKEAASRLVGGNPTVFSDWLHFAVVHNPAAAFGFSLGPYTWQWNLALTIGAIALAIPVSRDLARIDPLAPRALGLVVGGALGNFVSLVASPYGVVDFIAISFSSGTGLVLNVADVAAYTGLVLMLRTGFLIVGELRRSNRPLAQAVAEAAAVSHARPRFADREVHLPVHRDDDAFEFPADIPADAPARRGPPTVPMSVPQPEVGDQSARVLPFPVPHARPAGDRVLQVPKRDSRRGGRRR